MPAPESEMIQAIANGIADQQAMPDEKGIEDVLAIVEKLRAAAHAKGWKEGFEEACRLADEWYGNDTTGLECHEYVRSRIKDQGE